MSAQAVRIPLESHLPPEEAVRCLRGEEHPFALVGEWAGGGALLGSRPVRVARADEDPFALLDDQPAVEPGDAVVGGGWFGVLAYRLGERVERLPPPPPAPTETAAHRLAFYDHVVCFDGERWWLEALSEEAGAAHAERWQTLLTRAAEPAPFRVGALVPRAPGEAGYVLAVEDCVRRIAQGELFQANLTLRLDASFSGDPLDLFAHALPRARPRFGAFLPGVVSLSPERFLRRIGRRVESDPVKGTADDPDTLRASGKDAAEHVMIVDLMRNDLGRVCAYGSIGAHAPRIEPHANVWHLVSTVSGELRPGVGDADLLRATFPPGSVTGAPKVQAMKVIAELESTRREAYTGAIGYASPLAGLELSVTIRTFEIARDRLWLGAGGGIVADSDPAAELAEALAKAGGPAAAASTRVAGPGNPSGGRVSRPTTGGGRGRRALEHGPRPDPALGLLETILVRDGAAPALAAHLARLRASAQELYDIAGPGSIEIPGGSGRLRVTLTPDGDLRSELLRRGEIAIDGPFLPYLLPGGLGRHKWADRRLATALGPDALLVDADGAVLEATWANVFLVEDGRVVTPPADGRILPGVHRARIGAAEEAFGLERLERADEVFLTSALRRYSPSSSGYCRA